MRGEHKFVDKNVSGIVDFVMNTFCLEDTDIVCFCSLCDQYFWMQNTFVSAHARKAKKSTM